MRRSSHQRVLLNRFSCFVVSRVVALHWQLFEMSSARRHAKRARESFFSIAIHAAMRQLYAVHFLVIAERAAWHARESDELIATRVLGFSDDLI
jgi:hypothetical protein